MPLPAESVARFAALYPGDSGKLHHDLADHPLLGLQALAEAATRMDPATVECRMAKNHNGAGFAFADEDQPAAADVIAAIARAGRWVMLAKAEQLPEYDELMHDVMGDLAQSIRRASGEPLRLQSYIFVSSPGTLTPFHMDPEYNVLFQISGNKTFSVYSPTGPWLSDEINERYHVDGQNLLAWEDRFANAGTANSLAPGEALYVPYKCPHWVEVGEQPSVSLSITWCTRASFRQEAAWRFNAWLRRRGLNPLPPAAMPAGSPGKALAWRMLDRAGLGRL